MFKNQHDFHLLVALKNDVVNNIESIQHDFTYPMDEGYKRYLQDFFANNPQFDDSQENFDAHIGYVGMLFNEYIY